MTIKKFEYTWAGSGSKTTPSGAKIQTGWVDGDQPTQEYFNWLDNRQDAKLDRIAKERIDTFYEDASDPDAMINTGIWSESWATTDVSENYMGSGAGYQYVDIKPYINSDGDPRVLALDAANNTIEMWDARTMTLITTTQDLSGDMIGGDTYHAHSMCSDGTYVFVMFANQTDNTLEVNAWTIKETAGSWTNYWAAVGETTLSGTVTISAQPTTRLGDMCVADSTQIACITANDTDITADTDVAVQILLKTDGSTATYGAGDCPTADTCVANPTSICSDGTNVYWTAAGATRHYLCSCQIADATDGSSGWGGPQNLNTASTGSVVCAGGNKVLIGLSEAAWSVDELCLYTATDAEENCDRIKIGDNQAGTPSVGDKYYLNNPSSICFDGLSFWLISDYIASSLHTGLKLTKIDAAKLSWATAPGFRYLDEVEPSVFLIAPDETSFDSAGFNFRRCIFDGRDVWVNTEIKLAENTTGRIYRLPLAALRS